MGIKLAGEEDGLVAMDIGQAKSYLWSITDNGLAKATPLEEYPVQGRYGQGVINMRLPKEAAEVVAAAVGDKNSRLIVLMSTGSTKSIKLGKTIIGTRPTKPQPVVTINNPRNRVTGVVSLRERPATNGTAEADEDGSYSQLTLAGVK